MTSDIYYQHRTSGEHLLLSGEQSTSYITDGFKISPIHTNILQMDSNFTNPHHILQGHSNFTNPHQYITNGFKFHQSTPIYYKWIQISPIHIHQTCFFLALQTLIVSWWSLRKYDVLSFAKSWGLYGMSNDGISSNWLYSSSSMTFSTPTILLFPGITTY